MASVAPRWFRHWPLLTILFSAWSPNAPAAPVPVRHLQGDIHGFLVMRSEDGRVLAAGDLVRVAHGSRVTTRAIFHFKDGSIDEETTVFSERAKFQLLSDHHIQKGPSFPHPMDVSIDCPTGRITIRTVAKDGKEEVNADHADLPLDLANGIVPNLIENILPDAPPTTVSMLVATPKPRVVKLVISSQGDEPFSIAGFPRQAIRYQIKVELGGIAGVVAPVIGKQPPNIQAWIVGGQAPTLIREQGPLYPEGPIVTIELASPVFADATKSPN